jgi:hypothetical protein
VKALFPVVPFVFGHARKVWQAGVEGWHECAYWPALASWADVDSLLVRQYLPVPVMSVMTEPGNAFGAAEKRCLLVCGKLSNT